MNNFKMTIMYTEKQCKEPISRGIQQSKIKGIQQFQLSTKIIKDNRLYQPKTCNILKNKNSTLQLVRTFVKVGKFYFEIPADFNNKHFDNNPTGKIKTDTLEEGSYTFNIYGHTLASYNFSVTIEGYTNGRGSELKELIAFGTKEQQDDGTDKYVLRHIPVNPQNKVQPNNPPNKDKAPLKTKVEITNNIEVGKTWGSKPSPTKL